MSDEIVIVERWDSGQTTDSEDSASKELIYAIGNVASEAIAQSLADAASANSITLPSGKVVVKQSLTTTPLGGTNYEVHIQYGPRTPADFDFTFDTVGGTEKRTQSKETKQKKAPPGKTAADHKGAIGVNNDSVEGVDVPVAEFKWTETHNIPIEACTFAFARQLYTMTHKLNDATFRGFPAKTVRFGGVKGGKKDETTATLAFDFIASPHATGLTVGDITGINKDGHDYLWVQYANDEDTSQAIKKPKAAYVERIFDTVDFSALGIGVDE